MAASAASIFNPNSQSTNKPHPFLQIVAANESRQSPIRIKRSAVICLRPGGFAAPEERWCRFASNELCTDSYLATNIASGKTVAFYVDADSNGVYSDTADYLRVFQGGATAAGALSTDDIFVDIYTTSGLGGVTALGLNAAVNTVQIV